MADTFLNTNRTVTATNNPEANVAQVSNNQNIATNINQATQAHTQNQSNAISPITIPIQIQPEIAQTSAVQTNNNVEQLQTNTNLTNAAPTPQTYNASNTNSNVVDFNQIYSSYQSAYGNNTAATSNSTSGVKKTSIGTTIVTPTNTNTNTVQGQYQSAYADTINSLLSTIITRINTGFEYDATSDTALQVAAEYAANKTISSLAGSGVLNSSSTAERVARVVSDLIPQYEQLAYTRWTDSLNQLASTAQLVMDYDSQQFEYWKDAKDREFKEKQFEYQKQQDSLDNAWRRVDELGYVDNNASKILGVKVGTLSKDAREAKEQQEFELKKMREQAQIEYQNNVALYKLKSELDTQQSKTLTEYEYTLANKYGTSSTKTRSLSSYKDIIENNYFTKDDITGEKKLSGNNTAWYYLQTENEAGRLSDDDALTLIDIYGLKNPIQKVTNNTIVITTQSGSSATLNLTSGATKEQLLNWGKSYGVDLSKYL